MTTALVACRPAGAPPVPAGVEPTIPPTPRGAAWRSRFQTIDDVEWLAFVALCDGHEGIYFLLQRVVMALRGARGVDLNTELLLFLEREGLLR